MERVIVTVKRTGESAEPDLEVPADIAAERLAALIADALDREAGSAGEAFRYRIEARLPGQLVGRVLDRDETLAEAGGWDGAWLTLVPAGGRDGASPPASTAASSAEASRPAGGFVWKQLDE